jgi:hypothetical protein
MIFLFFKTFTFVKFVRQPIGSRKGTKISFVNKALVARGIRPSAMAGVD